MPSREPAQPWPKTQQLARGERRHWRRIASPKQWQAIIQAKGGPCRVCGQRQEIEFHHLIARSHGGEDVADNIVPLCRGCHAQITLKASGDVLSLVRGLRDAEYAYAVEKAGEAVWERLYGIEYQR